MTPELNVRTPLFDRLVGGERTLDRRGLRESVRRELERLFNTRSSFPAHRLAGMPLTVIDYGIPSLTSFSAGQPESRNELAAALRTAIETYEPRLAAVRVHVAAPPHERMGLDVAVEAELIADAVREPVSFILGIDTRSETVTVDARP